MFQAMAKKMFKKEVVEKDCPICYTLMVEPIQLPCKHYFCHRCARNLKCCAICRSKFEIDYFESAIDHKYADKIKKTFPSEYE